MDSMIKKRIDIFSMEIQHEVESYEEKISILEESKKTLIGELEKARKEIDSMMFNPSSDHDAISVLEWNRIEDGAPKPNVRTGKEFYFYGFILSLGRIFPCEARFVKDLLSTVPRIEWKVCGIVYDEASIQMYAYAPKNILLKKSEEESEQKFEAQMKDYCEKIEAEKDTGFCHNCAHLYDFEGEKQCLSELKNDSSFPCRHWEEARSAS